MPRETTLDDIKLFIMEYYEKYGVTPKLSQWVCSNGFPCNKETIVKKFGGYNNIIKSIGLKTYEYGQRHYNKTEMLELLKSSILKYRSIDYSVLRKDGIPYREVYRREFGSFKEAIAGCGLTNAHIILLRLYNDYHGENPISFLKSKLCHNNEFTEEQEELIERFQGLAHKGMTKDIITNIIPIQRIIKSFNRYSFLVICSGYNPPLFGYQYQACNGNICDSYEESLIDDFLYDNGYEYILHGNYPNSKLIYDWRIGNIIIEYTGYSRLKNRPHIVSKYIDRLKVKKQICDDNGLILLTINNVDISSCNELKEAVSRNGYGITL